MSLGYVEKIFRQRAQSGQMERLRYWPGPKRRMDADLNRLLVELVAEHADITITELLASNSEGGDDELAGEVRFGNDAGGGKNPPRQDASSWFYPVL